MICFSILPSGSTRYAISGPFHELGIPIRNPHMEHIVEFFLQHCDFLHQLTVMKTNSTTIDVDGWIKMDKPPTLHIDYK